MLSSSIIQQIPLDEVTWPGVAVVFILSLLIGFIIWLMFRYIQD